MAVEIDWLRDFLNLAESGHFGRSARARHVTQPAFSRRIRAVEDWAGATLIDRATYPAALTRAGVRFRERVRKVVAELDLAREELRGLADAADARVASFAALHTLALTFFPDWLSRTEKSTGPLVTRLMADNLLDCVEGFAAGRADFLLIYGHPEIPLLLDPSRFEHAVLGTERIVPVSAPAGRGRPRWRIADGSAYLRYAPDTFLGRAADLALARARAKPRLSPVYENAMAEALKAMALAGRGIAWLPVRAIEAEVASGALVPLDRDLAVAIEIRLYRAADGADPLIEAIWRAATAEPLMPELSPRKRRKR